MFLLKHTMYSCVSLKTQVLIIICFFFAQRGISLGSCFDQQQVRVPMGSPQIWAVQERIMSLQAFIESARPGSGSGIFVAEMLSTDL